MLEFCCLWLSELGFCIFLFLFPASWHSDSHEELTFAELVNKYPVLYGVRKFITVFKRALLLDLLLSQLNLLHTHHPLSFCLPIRLCLLLISKPKFTHKHLFSEWNLRFLSFLLIGNHTLHPDETVVFFL